MNERFYSALSDFIYSGGQLRFWAKAILFPNLVRNSFKG